MPGMTMPRVSFSLHSALTAWLWSPFSLLMMAVLIGLAYWYLRSDWMLAARGRRWPAHRTVSFLAGLVAVELALQSPVATFTGMYFQAHIVQHLLLMAVAPALLALGAPSTLLLQTVNRRTKLIWLRVLRSWPFAILTHPLTAWVMYFGFMAAFFLTPIINFAMLHMPLMDVLNLVFILGGCVYWWPMIGTDPIVHWKMGHGARMANMLLGGVFETFLGIAIMTNHNPVASMYSLSSTHAGGAMLWIATELGTVGGFVPIILQWMRSDERAAARADARADARARAGTGALAGDVPAGGATATVGGPASPAYQLAGGEATLTAWEAAWVARTGSVPASRPASPPPAGLQSLP